MNAVHAYLITYLAVSTSFRIIRLVKAVSRARQQRRGLTSSRPIFWVMTGGYLLFLTSAAYEAWDPSHRFSWGWSFLGLGIYSAALGLREYAMRDLGRFFSPDIEIRSQHRVVREGFYGVVRHPLLLCLMLEIIGVGLLFNAYTTLIYVGGGFYLPIILIRKHLEEKALLKNLGGAYALYQREVGAFLPKPQFFFRAVRGTSHA
jgi:protein-S-isoprenylcysteine O-methyltransferase Ste14